MDAPRPTYVGYGTCDCGRLEVLLYCVPYTPLHRSLLCTQCLERKGYSVPERRTADDLDEVNGKLVWKR